MERDEAVKLVERHVRELGERFDGVLVLVSWPDDEGHGSLSLYRGSGNYFARLGMAQDFLESDRQRDLARVLNPPESP